MTRQEAVAYLRPILESASVPSYEAALRLAVDALEAMDALEAGPPSPAELQAGDDVQWVRYGNSWMACRRRPKEDTDGT